MCEFLSWVKQGKKVYFLTKTQIDSPQGEALKRRFTGEGELLGHAAIRAYYEIDTGDDKECTDFETPKNFPDVIVAAIKRGDFRGMGTPRELLNPLSYAHIPDVEKADAVWEKAYADWEKAYADRKKADADWEKAYADWKKVDADREKAYAVWEKVDADWKKAYADWVKAYADRKKADADWVKADADRKKADADREKAISPFFWDLFAIPENRSEAWR